jgi:uncharacterized protein (TIGR03435 family)
MSGGRPTIEFSPGGIHATNVTLKLLIQVAYDIRADQLSGGPGWTDSEPYTVTAKGVAGAPAPPEAAQQELVRKRIQALLAERFHLVLQRQPTTASGYALIVAKNGPKMELAADPESRGTLRQIGRWQLRAEGVGMSTLVRFLSVHVGQTVIDRTGLEGRYNFRLDWGPRAPVENEVDWSAGGRLTSESIMMAVQEQIGLRLEAQKVTTDRYLIEHVQRPEEN